MRIRMHDPFSPCLRGGKVTLPSGPGTLLGVVESPPVEPLQWFYEDSPAPDDGLGQLKRTELVKVAEARGIKSYGTRDKLLARIRAHAAKG